jgi:hypothetical protein
MPIYTLLSLGFTDDTILRETRTRRPRGVREILRRFMSKRPPVSSTQLHGTDAIGYRK